MMLSFFVLILLIGASVGELEIRDGVPVDVIDNCVPEDPNSCGPDACCIRDEYMYMEDYPGERPAYRLKCEPLGRRGSWCSVHIGAPVCPCADGLVCQRGDSFLRQCLAIDR